MERKVKNAIIVDGAAGNFGGTAQIAYVAATVLRERVYNVVYFAGCGPIHNRLKEIWVAIADGQPFLNAFNGVVGALSGLHSKYLCEFLLSIEGVLS